MKLSNVPIWLLVIIFLAGVFIGFWGEAKLFPTVHKEITEKQVPVVTEKVVTKTDTQIQYVPKETVKYIDKKTGQEVSGREATDVQADILPTKVNVKVNGNPYQFGLLQNEQQKFDAGKVLLTQTSQVDFNVKLPTVDKTKYNAIGPLLTTESWGLLASRETASHRTLLMGGKKWDKKNGRGYEAGGAWQFKF